MAAPTYSIGTTGVKAHNPFLATVILPDIDVLGNVTTTVGGMAQTMRNGAQVLCKMPDGSLRWHVYDTVRSAPNKPVLIPV